MMPDAYLSSLSRPYPMVPIGAASGEGVIGKFFGELSFLPSLIGAILFLVVGWLVVTIITNLVVGKLLKATDIDNRIANWVFGQSGGQPIPIEKWIINAVYWIGMIFVLVGFLNALQLDVVSQPLNNFLQQIFVYLPRLGSAAVLLAVAWALATIAKAILTRGLARFNLDDQLAQQMGSEGDSPFLVNETLGNVLYWFIFLFFLPLVLDVLQLEGPLEPVQNLLDDILSALPKILTAVIIGAIGWLVAKVVSGIVTNLLTAAGADSIGEKFGLNEANGGLSLSSLAGTIVYVFILIPTAISALNALQIRAISEPAVEMLEEILQALPNIFAATLILGVFYVIGQFVSELVTNVLTGFGFNNVLNWLGLESVITPSAPAETPGLSGEEPAAPQAKTPSEIAGIGVMVAILLVGAVAAVEKLQFEVLTEVVEAILAIAFRVFIGVLIFAIGLYLANLAFRLITTSGGAQSNVLGQTARISILALVGAMALQQMGVATNIVNLAFGLLLGAIAVAIAIAFGLGGRDVASEQLREWISAFKSR